MPEFTVTVHWTSEYTGAKRRTRTRVTAPSEPEARREASLRLLGIEHGKTGRVVRHR
jgi:hypothetical protein